METNSQERLKRRPRSILGRDPIKFKPSRLIPVAIEFFLDLNQNSPRGFRKPIMIYSFMKVFLIGSRLKRSQPDSS